ncbi:MAG: PH domain-containing protein [Candidatus Heimdallarchaeota archaeon]|nr:MAG: PH domain-containing protein [Candidatus Heimdallarchaeota archaeon]
MARITIIKPEEGEGRFPTPEVRKIYPARKLVWKFYFTAFLIWAGIGLGLFIFLSFIRFVVAIDPDPSDLHPSFLDIFFGAIFWGITILTFLPVLILIPMYVNSMEFIVHGDELVVKKGIINKTVKYCPYRTVTNISTTVGPLDRLFGIGCVNIETAGKSGTSTSPEEKFEGLPLYHEIRDYILRQLRFYYSTISTSPRLDESGDVPPLQQEIINELREIRTLLKEK